MAILLALNSVHHITLFVLGDLILWGEQFLALGVLGFESYRDVVFTENTSQLFYYS